MSRGKGVLKFVEREEGFELFSHQHYLDTEDEVLFKWVYSLDV